MGKSFLLIAVNLVVIIGHITEISAQGEPCYTPNDSIGICVVLQQCPSLVNFYGQFQNDPRIINYLLISQRNCGTRSVRRNPLVCCNDPIINKPSQLPLPQPQPQPQPQPIPPPITNEPNENPFPPTPSPTIPTTQPTTLRTTTQIVRQTPFPTIPQTTPRTTPFTQNSDASRLISEPCHDPNGVEGVCKNIKECPSILSEFLVKNKDTAYVQYIKQSNARCRNMQPFICCPTETKSTNSDNVSLQGRLLTPEEGCGSPNTTVRKVVGGYSARPGDFPWMALIGYVNNLGDQSFKCGGSLITTRHVLTASHCILSTLSFVRLGEHDISSTTDGAVEDIKVIRSERHPNYNKRDGTNDIAILFLEHDASLSKRVFPICLPVNEPIRSRSFVDYQPFVAGWGRLQEGGKSSNVLQQLQLPVLDNAECKEQYKKQGKLISEYQFGDAVICAGYLGGGKDSCQGDSGGPLMQPVLNPNTRIHQYYQIGVVSYGIGCARTNTPGVYSSVQHFVDWIQDKIRE